DRFVEDEDARFGRQGAGDRHTLALPARQGSRQRPHLPGVEAHELGELTDALSAAVAGPTLVEPEDLVDGRLHRLTWVEARVRVLEHDLNLLAPASRSEEHTSELQS